MKRSYDIAYTETDIAQAQVDFLSKVYAWMFGGLLITALIALWMYSSQLYLKVAQSGLLFPLIIGEFVLVFVIASKVQKFKASTSGLLFLLYSGLNGITFSVLISYYTMATIQETFFITAAAFAAMSAYGYFTKRDLSGLGSFLFMGLIGVIIASVVNIFLGSTLLQFAISYIGVLVFAGLTAYDTQKLKEMSLIQLKDGEAASKGAISGALALYLDFINLFLFLLTIFGGGRD